MKNKKNKTINVLLVMMLVLSGLTAFLVITPNTTVKAYSWWDTGYGYKRNITIDHDMIDSNLVNFPLVVRIPSSIASKCQANGEDIRFIAGDETTEFYYEIEEWDAVSTSFVWVNVTSISSTVDTVFYLYYGNVSASDNQNLTSVWDSYYTMVQHLNETSLGNAGEYIDSTSYSNDGHGGNGNVSRLPSVVTGKIGSGQYFNHSKIDEIDCGNTRSVEPENITIEAWIKFAGWGEGHTYYTIWNKGNQCMGTQDWLRLTPNINKLSWEIQTENPDGWSTDTPYSNSDVDWHYIACSFSNATGGDYYMYIDSVLKNSNLDTDHRPIVQDSDAAKIGSYRSDSLYSFNGTIDEFRISSVARNSSWINASYDNQNDTTNFMVLGNELQEGAEQYCSYTGYEHGNWSFSEHVRVDDTLDEDWWESNESDWHPYNRSYEWELNWTYAYNNSDGNADPLGFVLLNNSGMNRSQSLVNIHYNYIDVEPYQDVFMGVIYAYRSNIDFDMALYSEMYLALLTWNGTNLTNTNDSTLVETVSDAYNYMGSECGYTYDDVAEEPIPWYWQDSCPQQINGSWIKTIYNEYCGHVQTKIWDNYYGCLPFVEPTNWAYDGYMANATYENCQGHGLAVWCPNASIKYVADFDIYELWQLNYTLNESFMNCFWNGNRPHMDFPILNMSDISDGLFNWFNTSWQENQTFDDLSSFVKDFTNNLTMNSRAYTLGDDPCVLDTNDTVYYYSATLVNFSDWFIELWMQYFPEVPPPEYIPNNLLWLSIHDCTDGWDTFISDSAFVSFDVDYNEQWDPWDRAFYVDTFGNTQSWTGNVPDITFNALASAWKSPNDNIHNLHRYSGHMHYTFLIPLDELTDGLGVPLNVNDTFGLHIHTWNLDNLNICVWENWNETACDFILPEDYALIFNAYLNGSWPEFGCPLDIDDTSTTVWGEGEIGYFTGGGSMPPGGYSDDVDISCNETHMNWTMDQVNYTVNVTNTGTGTLTNITVNVTIPPCLDFNYSNISWVDTTNGTGWVRFNLSDVAPGESFELYITFDINHTCMENGTLLNTSVVVTVDEALAGSSYDETYYGTTTHLRVTYSCSSDPVISILSILPLLIALLLLIAFVGLALSGTLTVQQLMVILVVAIVGLIVLQVTISVSAPLLTQTETFLVADPGSNQILALTGDCDSPTVSLVEQYIGIWLSVSSGDYAVAGKTVTVQSSALYT